MPSYTETDESGNTVVYDLTYDILVVLIIVACLIAIGIFLFKIIKRRRIRNRKSCITFC